jgi:hyperosmotically inducible protein
MRTLLALALTLAAAAALAQSKRPDGSESFKALDANRDGALSRQEAAAEKELAKRFTRFDADKNGALSEEEYLKAMQDNDKRVLADGAITAKVKAALLAEKGVPSFAISVETYEGRVLLSGFVESAAVKAKAGKVAAAVAGVRKVENHLAVK